MERRREGVGLNSWGSGSCVYSSKPHMSSRILSVEEGVMVSWKEEGDEEWGDFGDGAS